MSLEFFPFSLTFHSLSFHGLSCSHALLLSVLQEKMSDCKLMLHHCAAPLWKPVTLNSLLCHFMQRTTPPFCLSHQDPKLIAAPFILDILPDLQTFCKKSLFSHVDIVRPKVAICISTPLGSPGCRSRCACGCEGCWAFMHKHLVHVH